MKNHIDNNYLPKMLTNVLDQHPESYCIKKKTLHMFMRTYLLRN